MSANLKLKMTNFANWLFLSKINFHFVKANSMRDNPCPIYSLYLGKKISFPNKI